MESLTLVAPISAMFIMDVASPGYMNRKPRKINELIIDVKRYARLFISGLFIAAISTCLFRILHVR